MERKLEKEFNFYLKNQDELVKKFNGKFIVIKGEEVLGSYDSHREAFEKTKVDHELGTFLIQLCEPGKDGYTLTFHSNVTFSFS